MITSLLEVERTANSRRLNISGHGQRQSMHDLHDDWRKMRRSSDGPHRPVRKLLSSQVNFVSSEIGWAIEVQPQSNRQLLKTSDGGQTWEQIAYSITDASIVYERPSMS